MTIGVEMKVVVLCGGKGLRMDSDIPKCLIEVKGKPILWWICSHFKKYGFNDFIFCLGNKGEMIKEYFEKTDFKIQFVDTGDRNKGDRLGFISTYLKDEENFFVTYADDLCNVDLNALLAFHKSHKGWCTLTAIKQQSEFGVLELDGNKIKKFIEKPLINNWINGGYYIMRKEILDMCNHLDLETDILTALTFSENIYAFYHTGQWFPINTTKDVNTANEKFLEG